MSQFSFWDRVKQRLGLYKAQEVEEVETFEIPDDPDWSDYLVINLEPTQSASVVVNDDDGTVIPDAEFRIDPIVDGERISDVDIERHTDENGLLELDGIIPGLEYHLRGISKASKEMFTLTMVLVP